MIKTNKKSKFLYGYITINYLWLTTIILCLTSLTMLSNSKVQSEKFQINTGVEDEIREKATEFIKKNQLDKAIALYDSALENYKHDWNLINFVVTNKFLLYKQAG
ncbi:MAG: hypothetical protein QME64_06690, partial [bacterium]|nr:hypothetical protein [bacterium]